MKTGTVLRNQPTGGTGSEKHACSGLASGEHRRTIEATKGPGRSSYERLIPKLYGMFLKSWPNPSLAEESSAENVFDAVPGELTYDLKRHLRRVDNSHRP